MDVELFLGLQEDWAEDSPHHLMILHEMFRHAAIEGQKEVEHIICWGHWQTLPQLNPKVGIPAIQLVMLQLTKEELLEIYLEVYKLHRLPGSPLGEPAILEEVLSSLPNQERHVRKRRPLQPLHDDLLRTPIPPGAIPPTEWGKMTQWRGV